MDKKTIIKTRLILERDSKILLLAQTTSNGGKFTLVGGTVEKHEYTKTTLIRETFEEIGIRIQSENLQLIHVLHKKKGKENRITVYFKTSKWQGKIKAMETYKFKGVAWFSVHNLPARTSLTVRHVIQQIKMGNLYSELSKK